MRLNPHPQEVIDTKSDYMAIWQYSAYLNDLLTLLINESRNRFLQDTTKVTIEANLYNLTSYIPQLKLDVDNRYPQNYLSKVVIDNYERIHTFTTTYLNLALTSHMTKYLVNLIYSLQFWEVYHLVNVVPNLAPFLKLLHFDVYDTSFGPLIRPPKNYLVKSMYLGFQYPFPYPFYNFSYHNFDKDIVDKKYSKVRIQPYIDITLKNVDIPKKRRKRSPTKPKVSDRVNVPPKQKPVQEEPQNPVIFQASQPSQSISQPSSQPSQSIASQPSSQPTSQPSSHIAFPFPMAQQPQANQQNMFQFPLFQQQVQGTQQQVPAAQEIPQVPVQKVEEKPEERLEEQPGEQPEAQEWPEQHPQQSQEHTQHPEYSQTQPQPSEPHEPHESHEHPQHYQNTENTPVKQEPYSEIQQNIPDKHEPLTSAPNQQPPQPHFQNPDFISYPEALYHSDDSDLDESDKPSPGMGSMDDEAQKRGKTSVIHQCHLTDPHSLQPCLKIFYGKNELLRHQEFVHATRKKIYKCVYCSRNGSKVQSYPRHDSLARHIRRKHGITGKENKLAVNYAKEHVEIIEDPNQTSESQLMEISTRPLPHPRFLNPDFTLKANYTGFLLFNSKERPKKPEDSLVWKHSKISPRPEHNVLTQVDVTEDNSGETKDPQYPKSKDNPEDKKDSQDTKKDHGPISQPSNQPQLGSSTQTLPPSGFKFGSPTFPHPAPFSTYPVPVAPPVPPAFSQPAFNQPSSSQYPSHSQPSRNSLQHLSPQQYHPQLQPYYPGPQPGLQLYPIMYNPHEHTQEHPQEHPQEPPQDKENQ